MKLNKLFLMLPALILATGAITFAQESTDLFRWTSSSVEQQLAADTTVIPAEQGAIFVPALTRSAAEPEIAVLKDQKIVAQGTSGHRILLDPGTYTVRLGSGATNQALTYDATVEKGVTTTVEVQWGGLRVEVVDEGNIPHRGTYELIRVSDRAILGTGYGADTLQAETLQTWILTPGVYRIVRPGETYRARSNFTTVSIPP